VHTFVAARACSCATSRSLISGIAACHAPWFCARNLRGKIRHEEGQKHWAQAKKCIALTMRVMMPCIFTTTCSRIMRHAPNITPNNWGGDVYPWLAAHRGPQERVERVGPQRLVGVVVRAREALDDFPANLRLDVAWERGPQRRHELLPHVRRQRRGQLRGREASHFMVCAGQAAMQPSGLPRLKGGCNFF
jgi:hypothetical protein